MKKRQAVNLMHRIGAVRVSRELAVEQRDLVRWLDRRISEPSVAVEQQRHETVIDRTVELKAETAARSVKIVLPVSLASGLLTVSFVNGPELVEKLFPLARVFGHPASSSRPLSFSALSRAFAGIRVENGNFRNNCCRVSQICL